MITFDLGSREAMVLRYEAGLSIQELSVAIGVDEARRHRESVSDACCARRWAAWE